MDLEAALGQFNKLMQDEASAKKLKDIAEVLNNTIKEKPMEESHSESYSSANPEEIIKNLSSNPQFLKMISSLKGQSASQSPTTATPDSSKLLEALKPFLSNERQCKIDEVKQLLKLVDVAKLLDIGGKNA